MTISDMHRYTGPEGSDAGTELTKTWQGPQTEGRNPVRQTSAPSEDSSHPPRPSIDALTFETASILRPEAVLPALRAQSRDQVLRAIGARAQALYGQDAGQVVDALRARERLAPTAMGAGIAIPHARLPVSIGVQS